MDFFEALKKKAANVLVRNNDGIAVYSEEWAGINATIEAFKEMAVGKPLIGYILGRPIVILAFEAEVDGLEDLGEVKPEYTADRHVPVDNWFDNLVEAIQGKVCSCGVCGPPLDNHKG